MGEYYQWVNVDKKEYISPSDFDYGSKATESFVKGNQFLRALKDLLSKEWDGDHIFWMGDELTIDKETTNYVLKKYYEQSVQGNYTEDIFDTLVMTYKNVSGLFKAAEEKARREIGFYLEDVKTSSPYALNEYGISIENPFEGLFERDGKDFTFTLNHTKRVAYSFENIKVRFLDGTERDGFDPLPILMIYGRGLEAGLWVGDIIGVSDELPEGYELLTEIQRTW